MTFQRISRELPGEYLKEEDREMKKEIMHIILINLYIFASHKIRGETTVFDYITSHNINRS